MNIRQLKDFLELVLQLLMLLLHLEPIALTSPRESPIRGAYVGAGLPRAYLCAHASRFELSQSSVCCVATHKQASEDVQ